MPTLLDRAARPLARRGWLNAGLLTATPQTNLALRADPKTHLDDAQRIGAALSRLPQRRGVLPEQARQFARRNEWCRAAINRLKDRVARAERVVAPLDPAKPYARDVQARLTYLVENPNPRGDSWRAFIEPVLEDLLTLGKGGWEYVPNWRGWPVALFPFDAAFMTIDPRWDGDPKQPRYFWTPGPARSLGFRNDELTMLVLNPSTDRPDGLSPIDVLQESVEADAATSRFVRDMLEKQPPPGWLDLGPAAGRRVVDAVREKLATDVLGHGGMLVTGGLEQPRFTSLWSGTSRDQELQAWSIYFARKICAVYGISPQELGLTMDVNRATADSQQDVSDESGYMSLLELVQEYVNREVLGKFGMPERLNLGFRFRALTQAQRERKLRYASAMTAGLPVATYNEARAEADLPPLPLGNAVYVASGRGPIAMLGPDAAAYRRQAVEETAALADQDAQVGGEPGDHVPTPEQPDDDQDDAQADDQDHEGAA